MSDILAQILARKSEELRSAQAAISTQGLAELIDQIEAPRGFERALLAKAQAAQPAVIAEIKKASPSKGLIRADFDPARFAHAYEIGGAACLSVLTDRDFFQGAAEYLKLARASARLPALRKDFMLDPYQILESRAWGADCVLLIVAALGDVQMNELYHCAQEQGMDVLVEVHDAPELVRALALPGGILGINNRNLRTFETRLETTLELLEHIPADRFVVTESGIHGSDDMRHMLDHGVRGFLIGEHLMRAPDPGEALAQWLAEIPPAG